MHLFTYLSFFFLTIGVQRWLALWVCRTSGIFNVLFGVSEKVAEDSRKNEAQVFFFKKFCGLILSKPVIPGGWVFLYIPEDLF